MSLAHLRIRSRRAAFSLTEMLVVLVIIVILLGIAIPAFRSMSQSQEKTASEARLGFALQAARDAAINLGEGNDVAAVFTYEMGGPMRIVPCQVAGTLVNVTNNSATLPVTMEVFVPLSSIEPTSLPTGWTVRAWRPAPRSMAAGTTTAGATPPTPPPGSSLRRASSITRRRSTASTARPSWCGSRAAPASWWVSAPARCWLCFPARRR
ncbi:MAG: prepilin-type N-terminal cleavage/methylation domain-containing protein [Phycisphaerales bacterium]